MQAKLLQYLACPACGGSFVLSENESKNGLIAAGQLGCEACGRRYPIVDDIPRMVPPSNYADNFGFQWNRFRRTQLDSHSKTTISRDRLLATTGWEPEELRGALVLDIGCGAGRFTEAALSLGAEVIAMDYSNAVDACWDNLRSHPRLHVVQADIYRLPLKLGVFDFIYCLGVLQHTPDPRQALLALPRHLKPAGRLAVDFYMRHWKSALNPKYWLRPLTCRMHTATLFHLVERAVPWLLPISRGVSRIPRIGKDLSRMIPVANYDGVLPLDSQQLREWAVLDTFDYFSPAYDQPQRPIDVRRWLTEAGLSAIDVRHDKFLIARAERGSSAAAA